MYTNQYAQLPIMKKRTTKPHYVNHNWDIHGSDNVSEQEILAYLGCSVVLSVNPIHQLQNVFSSDPYMCNPGIRSVFTLKRFQKIGQYLSLCDKQLEPGRD